MTDRPSDGYQAAHTPGPAGSDQAAGEADQGAPDLTGADPADLLAGLEEEQAADALELVAETALAARRGAGRPQGALNRKNNDMIAYLQAKGHRDPWVTLSLIQSADFGDLCAMVGAVSGKSKMAVLKLQVSAAESIMNYHHSKRPQQLELPAGDKRPLMVIGEMNINQVSHEGFMSAGEPPDRAEQNQRVIDGEAVREQGGTDEGDVSP